MNSSLARTDLHCFACPHGFLLLLLLRLRLALHLGSLATESRSEATTKAAEQTTAAMCRLLVLGGLVTLSAMSIEEHTFELTVREKAYNERHDIIDAEQNRDRKLKHNRAILTVVHLVKALVLDREPNLAGHREEIHCDVDHVHG